MLKIINCKNKNYSILLKNLLERRKYKMNLDTEIVPKILRDIRKYKFKALLKYENKFSNNSEIKPNIIKIRKSIKSLDPKIKKAIDFAYSRILKFHSLQKAKNIKYIDKYNNKIEYNYIPIKKVGIRSRSCAFKISQILSLSRLFLDWI